MNNEKKYIDPYDLGTAQLLLKNKLETCGFLLENQFPDNPERLQVYIDKLGEEKDGRAQCQYSKYTKIIFHTHPYLTGGYPSAEDILKVMKLREDSKQYPLSSIIFTTWGIWEMDSPKKIKLSLEQNQHLIRKINDEFAGIRLITEKGKNYRKNLENMIHNICDTLSKNLFNLTNGKTELRISFTPWYRIPRKGYILRI